jgi:predicted DNA-binding transcriptional regulator AlpA
MSSVNTNAAALHAAAAMQTQPRKPRRLLGQREVAYRTSISRAAIYRLLAEGRELGVALFPLPVQVTKGRIGWHEHEIEAWIENRPRLSPAQLAATQSILPPNGSASIKT